MSASYVVFRTPHSRWIIATPREASRERGRGGGPGPRSTTQIDNALRLSWGTDVQPGPTQYPKHGSHGAPARPPRPRSRLTSHHVDVALHPLEANEADGPSSSLSHAFDDAFAEDAVGANHQREDHQDVRREVLGAAADVGVDVAGRHVLHDADDEPADDRPRNRVEAAEDHHGENLEAHEREVHVDAEHVAPEHAAQRGDDAGHGPRHAEVALHVD